MDARCASSTACSTSEMTVWCPATAERYAIPRPIMPLPITTICRIMTPSPFAYSLSRVVAYSLFAVRIVQPANRDPRISEYATSHRPHGQAQDLAVNEVIHDQIVEMEGVHELLVVVGHEGETVVAGLGALAEFLHRRRYAVVRLDLQHAVET